MTHPATCYLCELPTAFLCDRCDKPLCKAHRINRGSAVFCTRGRKPCCQRVSIDYCPSCAGAKRHTTTEKATMSNPFTMKATSGGGGSEVPSAGNHHAVCVAIIDLGTHEETFKGVSSDNRKVYIAWELVEEKLAGTTDRNHIVYEKYTLSFNSKAKLRHAVEGWLAKKFKDGEGFDLPSLKGSRCLVNVVHKPNGEYVNANVGGISPIHKSIPVVAPKLTPIVWFLGCSERFPDVSQLPLCYGRKLEDLIEECQENAGKSSNGQQQPVTAGAPADDTDPF